MTRKFSWSVVVVLSVVLAFSGCKARKSAAAPPVTTQTVAPAAAQPAPTGTDAMTQTVNVDDGRSEEEGASGAAADTTGTPAATATTATTHAKAKKRH